MCGYFLNKLPPEEIAAIFGTVGPPPKLPGAL
jgi:hypothetical protein